MTRPQCGEAGQAILELVILVIPLLLLVYVAISLGRWAETKGVLADAANAAAEASAASPGGAVGGLGSQSAASQAASGVIGAHGLGCGSPGVSVTLAVNAGGTTTATVTCVAAASQASFPGLPGSLTLSASDTATVTPYRSGP
jgi:Flp pilus assembly protein TadG